jgi:hypothetical protein
VLFSISFCPSLSPLSLSLSPLSVSPLFLSSCFICLYIFLFHSFLFFHFLHISCSPFFLCLLLRVLFFYSFSSRPLFSSFFHIHLFIRLLSGSSHHIELSSGMCCCCFHIITTTIYPPFCIIISLASLPHLCLTFLLSLKLLSLSLSLHLSLLLFLLDFLTFTSFSFCNPSLSHSFFLLLLGSQFPIPSLMHLLFPYLSRLDLFSLAVYILSFCFYVLSLFVSDVYEFRTTIDTNIPS